MYSKEILQIIRRLQQARISLMQKQPFYAALLLHMQFALDEDSETAYTDGSTIVFGPDFIHALSDGELEFVLMHEVLHAALNHCGRMPEGAEFDDFGQACDIVVNSNILYSFDMDISKITLRNFGESMHLTPDGQEGYLYTVEEVLKMISLIRESGGFGKEDPPAEGCSQYAAGRIDGGFDDHTYWNQDPGESGESSAETESNAPDSGHAGSYNESADRREDKENEMKQTWLQRMIDATMIAQQIGQHNGSGKNCGQLPLGVERLLKELMKPQTDWRTVLDTFIQEEVNDYSFSPPDRRFQDSMFLLPDFNEKDETVENILFMIDTSGSMSDQMITAAYSEINGAIEQFNGKLKGWLGFFDACVTEPEEFSSVDELRIIRPKGGGGTSFGCIFDYVKGHMDTLEPASIVILTDGYAPFPDESSSMGIPVLWLINNEQVTPPWGRLARIRLEDGNESL